MDMQHLLDLHKPQLIDALRAVSPKAPRDAEVSALLSCILDDEEKVEGHPPLRPMVRGEDVFWWCVEQMPASGWHHSSDHGRPFAEDR